MGPAVTNSNVRTRPCHAQMQKQMLPLLLSFHSLWTDAASIPSSPLPSSHSQSLEVRQTHYWSPSLLQGMRFPALVHGFFSLAKVRTCSMLDCFEYGIIVLILKLFFFLLIFSRLYERSYGNSCFDDFEFFVCFWLASVREWYVEVCL